MSKVFLTGINGQDCSYLAEYMLELGHDVYGIIRRHSDTLNQQSRLDGIRDKIHVTYGDMTDATSLENVLSDVMPDYIFNIAAQSHVRISFDIPVYTADVNALGSLRLLDAYRRVCPKAKYYQACYSADTHVVTPMGLKSYVDIKEGDWVYTTNIFNNKLELKKVKKILTYNYIGDMVFFKGRRIDSLVTPNHKILLDDDNIGLRYIQAKDVKSKLKQSRNSHLSCASPYFTGEIMPIIDFNDFIDISNIPYNLVKNLITKMELNDFLYLLGIYIGDGWTKETKLEKRKATANEFTKTRNKKGQFVAYEGEYESIERPSNYIHFAIPDNDAAYPKIESILNKYNIEYRRRLINFEFSSYTLARMFKMCGGNVYEKHIPEYVFKYDPTHLIHLFDGIIDSDGSRRGGDSERHILSTTSKQLADDFVRLCIYLSKSPKIGIKKAKATYFIRDKRYIGSKDSFVVYSAFQTKRKIYSTQISTEYYNGIVWCLEVEDNHNFLTERNGFYMFSGNSSSEMFGLSVDEDRYQRESTPMNPTSPYGCAKVFAYNMTRHYRRAYGLHACNGILFNHESPRRGTNFVTQKVVMGAVRIKLGLDKNLELGNMDSYRDWGHSYDYVRAMWLIVNHIQPMDFVVATGETHSVREMCELVFDYLGLDYRDCVIQNPKFMRAEELPYLRGDSTKIRTILGWQPKYSFESLMVEMVDYWLKKLS